MTATSASATPWRRPAPSATTWLDQDHRRGSVTLQAEPSEVVIERALQKRVATEVVLASLLVEERAEVLGDLGWRLLGSFLGTC